MVRYIVNYTQWMLTIQATVMKLLQVQSTIAKQKPKSIFTRQVHFLCIVAGITLGIMCIHVHSHTTHKQHYQLTVLFITLVARAN